jgi:cytochrome c biogenesis protein CcdA
MTYAALWGRRHLYADAWFDAIIRPMTGQKSITLKESILYTLAGLTSLFVLGYSVHMLIGDMVSPATERLAIAIACLIGVIVIGLMMWDVARQRKKRASQNP